MYRTEATIRRCLDSVLAQTCRDYEVVIVDDGSPDNAGRICCEYAACHSNFHVLHQENRGIFSARQTAIDYVTAHEPGEAFLMFLDSDDTYRPNTLECVRQAILRTGADMILFHYDCTMPDGEILWSSRKRRSPEGLVTDRAAFYRIVLMNDAYNALWRKATALSVFRKADQKDMSVSSGEDLLRSLRLYRYTRRALFLPDVLYNYMENPDSITRSVTAENYFPKFYLNEAVWEFLREEPVWGRKDLARYWRAERKNMEEILRMVALLQGTPEQISGLLEQLRSDPYYPLLLEHLHRRGPWLRLLDRRRYRTLCRAARIYTRTEDLLKDIYHCIRK